MNHEELSKQKSTLFDLRKEALVKKIKLAELKLEIKQVLLTTQTNTLHSETLLKIQAASYDSLSRQLSKLETSLNKLPDDFAQEIASFTGSEIDLVAINVKVSRQRLENQMNEQTYSRDLTELQLIKTQLKQHEKQHVATQVKDNLKEEARKVPYAKIILVNEAVATLLLEKLKATQQRDSHVLHPGLKQVKLIRFPNNTEVNQGLTSALPYRQIKSKIILFNQMNIHLTERLIHIDPQKRRDIVTPIHPTGKEQNTLGKLDGTFSPAAATTERTPIETGISVSERRKFFESRKEAPEKEPITPGKLGDRWPPKASNSEKEQNTPGKLDHTFSPAAATTERTPIETGISVSERRKFFEPRKEEPEKEPITPGKLGDRWPPEASNSEKEQNTPGKLDRAFSPASATTERTPVETGLSVSERRKFFESRKEEAEKEPITPGKLGDRWPPEAPNSEKEQNTPGKLDRAFSPASATTERTPVETGLSVSERRKFFESRKEEAEKEPITTGKLGDHWSPEAPNSEKEQNTPGKLDRAFSPASATIERTPIETSISVSERKKFFEPRKEEPEKEPITPGRFGDRWPPESSNSEKEQNTPGKLDGTFSPASATIERTPIETGISVSERRKFFEPRKEEPEKEPITPGKLGDRWPPEASNSEKEQNTPGKLHGTLSPASATIERTPIETGISVSERRKFFESRKEAPEKEPITPGKLGDRWPPKASNSEKEQNTPGKLDRAFSPASATTERTPIETGISVSERRKFFESRKEAPEKEPITPGKLGDRWPPKASNSEKEQNTPGKLDHTFSPAAATTERTPIETGISVSERRKFFESRKEEPEKEPITPGKLGDRWPPEAPNSEKEQNTPGKLDRTFSPASATTERTPIETGISVSERRKFFEPRKEEIQRRNVDEPIEHSENLGHQGPTPNRIHLTRNRVKHAEHPPLVNEVPQTSELGTEIEKNNPSPYTIPEIDYEKKNAKGQQAFEQISDSLPEETLKFGKQNQISSAEGLSIPENMVKVPPLDNRSKEVHSSLTSEKMSATISQAPTTLEASSQTIDLNTRGIQTDSVSVDGTGHLEEDEWPLPPPPIQEDQNRTTTTNSVGVQTDSHIYENQPPFPPYPKIEEPYYSTPYENTRPSMPHLDDSDGIDREEPDYDVIQEDSEFPELPDKPKKKWSKANTLRSIRWLLNLWPLATYPACALWAGLILPAPLMAVYGGPAILFAYGMINASYFVPKLINFVRKKIITYRRKKAVKKGLKAAKDYEDPNLSQEQQQEYGKKVSPEVKEPPKTIVGKIGHFLNKNKVPIATIFIATIAIAALGSFLMPMVGFAPILNSVTMNGTLLVGSVIAMGAAISIAAQLADKLVFKRIENVVRRREEKSFQKQVNKDISIRKEKEVVRVDQLDSERRPSKESQSMTNPRALPKKNSREYDPIREQSDVTQPKVGKSFQTGSSRLADKIQKSKEISMKANSQSQEKKEEKQRKRMNTI